MLRPPSLRSCRVQTQSFRTADNRDPSNRCRLCNFWGENHSRFLRCTKLASVRNTIYKRISAMGVQRSEMLSRKSWLTGLDANNKLIPEAYVELFYDSTSMSHTET